MKLLPEFIFSPTNVADIVATNQMVRFVLFFLFYLPFDSMEFFLLKEENGLKSTRV